MTLREIARLAGVSHATVSLALRNDPRLAPETVRRIHEQALKCGYRPNPLVSAYQSQVRRGRIPTDRAIIAWVNDHAERNFWRSTPWMSGYLEGADGRALELGYALEVFQVENLRHEKIDRTISRLAMILATRNIAGVILPWVNLGGHGSFHRCWEDFAVALLGNADGFAPGEAAQRHRSLEYHQANADFYFNTLLAHCELRRRGCQRIGYQTGTRQDRLTHQIIRAAYLAEQSAIGQEAEIPVLFHDEMAEKGPDRFEQWVRAHRLDAVMSLDANARRRLVRMGARVPEDVAFAHLNIGPETLTYSGIDVRHDLIGAAAVDLVTSQLMRNERGRPRAARKLLVQGAWRDGVTAARGP